MQRTPPTRPATHNIHEDIRNFAITSVFISDSAAYILAFEALKDSSAAKDFSVQQLVSDGRLFVSADFANTVKSCNGYTHLSNAFQRPIR